MVVTTCTVLPAGQARQPLNQSGIGIIVCQTAEITSRCRAGSSAAPSTSSMQVRQPSKCIWNTLLSGICQSRGGTNLAKDALAADSVDAAGSNSGAPSPAGADSGAGVMRSPPAPARGPGATAASDCVQLTTETCRLLTGIPKFSLSAHEALLLYVPPLKTMANVWGPAQSSNHLSPLHWL